MKHLKMSVQNANLGFKLFTFWIIPQITFIHSTIIIDNLLDTSNCSRLWSRNAKHSGTGIVMVEYHEKPIKKWNRSAIENI